MKADLDHIRYETPQAVEVLDQRLLPHQEKYITCRNANEMAGAIRDMVLRGAPLIGIAAAMGIALEFEASSAESKEERQKVFADASEVLLASRPTAVNLKWAVERMRRCLQQVIDHSSQELKPTLRLEALNIWREDVGMNKKIGDYGVTLFDQPSTLLTHCNAGALATGGYGTALGVIRSVFQNNKINCVFVDETRPYLQGARLTAWELVKAQIPVKLIADSMAGFCMQQG